jgi:hypothetical protein
MDRRPQSRVLSRDEVEDVKSEDSGTRLDRLEELGSGEDQADCLWKGAGLRDDVLTDQAEKISGPVPLAHVIAAEISCLRTGAIIVEKRPVSEVARSYGVAGCPRCLATSQSGGRGIRTHEQGHPC